MKFIYPVGATPLDLNEIEALIPQHITTQTELNEWEQNNILEAELWLHKKALNLSEILNIQSLKEIHYKMFQNTWRWAGKFRDTNKNIGISWETISQHLGDLLEDIIYQCNSNTYCIDEIAARFHHRLVAIHPFVNGNGRHARIITDVFLTAHKRPRFTWGSKNLNAQNKTRETYINSLRAADMGNYQYLFDFVRT